MVRRPGTREWIPAPNTSTIAAVPRPEPLAELAWAPALKVEAE
ncbi:MAG: hypothetical protein ACXWUR_05745 [Allosphingosinicella sp.]